MVLREFGDPAVLRLEEIETPKLEAGEVLVRVQHVSVNVTLDILLRKGMYPRTPPLPHVLGCDPTGEVVAVGSEVDQPAVGERVFVHTSLRSAECPPGREAADPGPDQMIGVHRWGGYAEYVAVPAENAFVLPPTLPYPDATVVMRHLPTARHLLHCRAALTAGEWVLVMGAAGGLASCCIQVAKQMQAQVIGAAGTDERVDIGRRFGADYGINYRQQNLADEVRRITGGAGVQVVAENIGDPDLWPAAINCLGKHGRLVTAGAHAGGNVPLDLRTVYLNRITIIGDPGCDFPDIEGALEAARDGAIQTPLIDRTMPLDQAAEAHRLVERRALSGKILLDPTAWA
jgi:NADPH:quinone reductase-like Zn-dependent oxidoreductase